MLSVIQKNKLLVALVVIASFVILGSLIVAGRSKNPTQAAGPPPLPVEVVLVERKDVPLFSEWIGTTDGMVNAEIKAQVTGYLLRQTYQEGSFVKKGQLLFEIDPRPFQATLEQATGQVAHFQGQLEQAKALVQQAEAQSAHAASQLQEAKAQLAQTQANQVKTQLDVDKYAPLVQQKAVTQREFDNAVQANAVSQAETDAAKARVGSMQAQLALAKAQISNANAGIASAKGQLENASAAVKTASINLGFTRIVSPIDGVAGIAQAQVGNLVSTSGSPLTTVSALDPIKVYFTLNEQEYLNYTRPTLADPQNASLAQLDLELILADGTTYPQRGKFYFADREVDPKTGAIRLVGIFTNPGSVLRPGQFGRVRAVTRLQEQALLIPQRAVTELQGTYQVAVVGSDNKVTIRNVKLGERSGSMWVVEEGLEPGESIVAEGTAKVRPGMVVVPKPFASQASG